MKKFSKFITVVLVAVLCLFTPSTPVVMNGLLKLATSVSAEAGFTAPNQDTTPFITEEIGTYDLAEWTKPSSSYLVTQQVTKATNKSFYENNHYVALSSDSDITTQSGFATPYVVATNTQNVSARGCYTTNAISLPANGHYIVEIEYRLNEQNGIANTTQSNAFGTFYLNDYAITLQGTGWQSAAFYVQTDVLEAANVTPELYFGSRDENALGAIYWGKFTITATSSAYFNDKINELHIDPTHHIDFSKANTEYVAISGNFANSKFAGTTTSNAESRNEIIASSVPGTLGFDDQQPDFYAKDGSKTASVMLMEAENSNISLVLEDYTFQPKPHEVYMFQFYSIATADENFDSFYFTITPTEDAANSVFEQIPTISYQYYNGWQLNTVFFVAGHNLNQSYTLGFSLADTAGNTTGWVCLDEFKIYKVNGSYAVNNAKSSSVHDTYDMNANDDKNASLAPENGYFELGTAADTVTSNGSGYPYPLVADKWTTNQSTNGIVNLDDTLWNENFGAEHPGKINNVGNNNVYMMHNTTTTHNILTSPALTVTAGETTHVTFDAYSKNTTATKAWIITASTGENGNLTDIVHLGNAIEINEGAWHHYEFNIKEDANAVSRSYYLQFEMDATGYAYIDNVVISEEAAQNAATNDIDLTNPLKLSKIWEANNNAIIHATNNGLTLENIGGQKTIVKNNFAYNLTSEKYYEFVISARGNCAYLGLDGYEGLLKVTTDAINPDMTYEYKLYVKVDESTTANFQITLGYVSDKKDTQVAEIVDGKIFMDSFQVNTVEEDVYNDAKEVASENSRIVILTPADATEEDSDNADNNNENEDNNFFGENWWYLIPTLITAFAILFALTTFLLRRVKFDKHITKKHTSYARDMRLKNQQNKIVAQKAAKVDNIVDEPKNN